MFLEWNMSRTATFNAAFFMPIIKIFQKNFVISENVCTFAHANGTFRAPYLWQDAKCYKMQK
jgi:hypothetical protein